MDMQIKYSFASTMEIVSAHTAEEGEPTRFK
jgi:hypothetical protein